MNKQKAEHVELAFIIIMVMASVLLIYAAWGNIKRSAETHQYIQEARQVVEHLEAQQAELLRERDALQARVDELRREREEVLQRLETWLDTWTIAEFEATAYTHVAVPGVPDINGTGDGITATGTEAREGIVAVDPAVIPLGSQLWVEGFGWLSAEDTGGAIKGNRIDIFHDSRDLAMRWGRQTKKVVYQR